MFNKSCRNKSCRKKATHDDYCAEHAMDALLNSKAPPKTKKKVKRKRKEDIEVSDSYNDFYDRFKKMVDKYTKPSDELRY